MTYDYITRYTASRKCWTPGREGHKVEGITIHHWGASRHLDFLGIVNFLCSPHPTSAHYVAQGVDKDGNPDPKVACIVDPENTAWHAGNWQANLREIGIECRPHPTARDYQVVGELVANLRKTYGNVPLYPHRHWTATECPGNWDLDRIEQVARKAADAGSDTADPKPPKKKPKPKPKGPGLEVDGVLGVKSTEELQRQLGTYVDGWIDGQNPHWKSRLWAWPRCRYNAVHSGSKCVRALQKKIGVLPVDGLLGPDTNMALQRFVNRHLPKRHEVKVDGKLGTNTAKAVQRVLNDEKFRK